MTFTKTETKPKIRKIQTSLLMSILSMVLLTFILVGSISVSSSKKMVNKGLNEEMNTQSKKVTEQIEKSLFKHASIPATLAKVFESTGEQISKQGFEKMVKSASDTNAETFGTGIFMEAYKYKPELKWFAPYAFKDKNGVSQYTEDYFKETSNYINEEWYIATKNTKKPFAWSAPYTDKVTGIQMVTAGAPIFDAQKNFIGAATGDIDLTSIQKMVTNIKIGETGFAFLLAEDGRYLAAEDASKILKINIKDDENVSLAKLGQEILINKTGQSEYEIDEQLYRTYYTVVPETGWIVCMAISEKEIAKPINELIRQIILMTLLSMTILTGVIVMRIRKIMAPIRPLQTVIEAIADGDFTQTLKVSANNELGQIAEDLTLMQEKLREALRNVSETGSDVAASAEELTASAEQTGHSAQQIADSIQEISESTDTTMKVADQVSEGTKIMVEGMNVIKQHIEAVSGVLETTNDRAQTGNKVVATALVKMSESNEVIQNASKAMNELDETSKRIGGIIDVIKQISDQTNLLALNASIEAARAGEHGRGFAVVADEIRKLAEQSNQSAEEIGNLIIEIQKKSKYAATTSEQGAQAVNDTVSVVETAAESFGDIVSSVAGIVTQIDEVVDRVLAINVSTQTMMGSVGHLTQVARNTSDEAQTIAAAAQEQSATMQEIIGATSGLANMASELQEELSQFKV